MKVSELELFLFSREQISSVYFIGRYPPLHIFSSIFAGNTIGGQTRGGYTKGGYTRGGYTRGGYTRDGYT